MHGKRFMRPKRKTVGEPALARRAAVRQSSRAWLHPRSRPGPDFWEERVRDLNHDFKELCRHNRDGSYATQADREHILDVVANQLHEMGYRGLRAQGLSPSTSRSWPPVGSSRSSPREPSRTGCRRCAGPRRSSARTTLSPAPTPPTASLIGCTSPTFQKQRSLAWNNSRHPHPLCPDVAALAGCLRPAP